MISATDQLIKDATTQELMQDASAKRDRIWGRSVTYSRKVFVPLTNMCRDTCGYCTFVKHPSAPAARIMTPEQVLAEARRGARKGCKAWGRSPSNGMSSPAKVSKNSAMTG